MTSDGAEIYQKICDTWSQDGVINGVILFLIQLSYLRGTKQALRMWLIVVPRQF